MKELTWKSEFNISKNTMEYEDDILTMEYEDDIIAILKCILWFYKSNSFNRHLLNHFSETDLSTLHNFTLPRALLIPILPTNWSLIISRKSNSTQFYCLLR